MIRNTAWCGRIPERGQAPVGLVLPLIGLMVVGLLALGRLQYVHLAILTAANDCATSAAQATAFDRMMGQGFAARENSLATVRVSQSVTTGGIYWAVSPHNAFGNTAGQEDYPQEVRWFRTFDGALFVGLRFLTVAYTLHLPWQLYKSNWDGGSSS